MNNTIYAFESLFCQYEEDWTVKSLHYTEGGAIKAMNDQKERARLEHDKLWEDELQEEKPPFEWDGRIKKYEIQP